MSPNDLGDPPARNAIGRVVRKAREPILNWKEVRWTLEDGTELSVLEGLRLRGDRPSPGTRGWILRSAWDQLLEESTLGQLIASPRSLEELLEDLAEELLHPSDSDHRTRRSHRLPPEVRLVLRAALDTRGLRDPKVYQEIRENVSALRVPSELAGGGNEHPSDVVMEDLTHLDNTLERLESRAREIEAQIEALGFRFDWKKRRIVVPSGPRGGGPPALLRDLVRALAVRLRVTSMSGIHQVAAELAPFLDAEALDTSRGSWLYKTLDGVLRAN